MIEFVNAKINIGLQIVRKRDDGFHDLESVFYPVGRNSGQPDSPWPFGDILEIVKCDDISEGEDVYVDEFKGVKLVYRFTGDPIDCVPEKNLICRVARKVLSLRDGYEGEKYQITLEKHLPFGAGMGGGSADAAFFLKCFDEVGGFSLSAEEKLSIMSATGSDCPFFLLNRPAFMEGKGENLTEIELPQLINCRILVISPGIIIPTAEAFSRVTPGKGKIDLRELPMLPIEDWKKYVENDFEKSVFPLYPQLREIKEMLYDKGADYASMSGSGSSLYGIFRKGDVAETLYYELLQESTQMRVALL